MADTAAHLVDRVFPEAPVRQWMLSVPFALRYRLAYDPSLVRDVLQIFVRSIFASIRRRTGIPASNRQARCGAVAFVQRFSDALNLDPHFHVLALDGIYVVDGRAEPLFRRAVPRLTRGVLGRAGPWQPASRYWHGNEPEWDLVADAVRGSRVLAGEAWFSAKRVSVAVLQREASRLASRPLPGVIAGREVMRALFVPSVAAGAPRMIAGVHVVSLDDVLA